MSDYDDPPAPNGFNIGNESNDGCSSSAGWIVEQGTYTAYWIQDAIIQPLLALNIWS